jgi:hypothetical protein
VGRLNDGSFTPFWLKQVVYAANALLPFEAAAAGLAPEPLLPQAVSTVNATPINTTPAVRRITALSS